MNVLSRLCIATTAALCLAAPSLQAQGVPQHVQPVLKWGGLNQKVKQFKNHALAVQSQGDLLTGLTQSYMSVMQGFHPDAALATVDALYAEVFGQSFVLGTNGFEAWGPPGALDPDSYTTVLSFPGGIAASLSELEMWQVDLGQPGLPPIVYPAGWPNPVEAYYYAARFGTAEPHVGLVMRFEQPARSQLVFIPMVEVPDAGLISASDAGAFLGMLNANGFATTSFAEWALARYLAATWGGDPGLQPFTLGGQVYAECDSEALAKCLDAALAAANAALDTEAQRHQDRLDEIAEEFADGKGWDLAAWCAAGAIPGAIGGSVVPGVGTAAGAILGGLAGATGGAVGWLFSTAGDADSAQEDIDEENQDHHDNICSIASDFGSDVMDCVNEYCPELADFAAGLIGDMMASLGC